MAGGVRDLKVWQEAVALAGDIVRAVRQAARRETKAVMDSVALTALAVAMHIADGYGQYTVPEQRQLYRTAKRELLRLETQIAVLRHAELLSHQMHAELLKRIHTVARLLAGYVVYLERQRVSEDDDGAASPASSSATSAS